MKTKTASTFVLCAGFALFPALASSSAGPAPSRGALPGEPGDRASAPLMLAQANGPAAPESPGAAPAPDEQPGPEQPSAPPAASSPAPSSTPEQRSAPPGQWVYTQQYGWIWMPYADAYTYAPPDGYGEPYMYVYAPASGWAWVVAPWVWGWGPWPYFGVYGAWHFGWYGHGWWRSPWRWHYSPAPLRPGPFRPAPFRGGAAVRGGAPAMHRGFAAPSVRAPMARPGGGAVRHR